MVHCELITWPELEALQGLYDIMPPCVTVTVERTERGAQQAEGDAALAAAMRLSQEEAREAGGDGQGDDGGDGAAVTIVESDGALVALTWDPPLCHACVRERQQDQQRAMQDFESRPVFVVKLPAGQVRRHRCAAMCRVAPTRAALLQLPPGVAPDPSTEGDAGGGSDVEEVGQPRRRTRATRARTGRSQGRPILTSSGCSVLVFKYAVRACRCAPRARRGAACEC